MPKGKLKWNVVGLGSSSSHPRLFRYGHLCSYGPMSSEKAVINCLDLDTLALSAPEISFAVAYRSLGRLGRFEFQDARPAHAARRSMKTDGQEIAGHARTISKTINKCLSARLVVSSLRTTAR